MFITLMFGFHINEKNLDHISTCDSLNENFLFLNKLWQAMKSGYYTLMWNGRDLGATKRSWQNEPTPTTPKASLHPKKIMLCMWWEWKGVICHEIFPENQTINSNKYCSQLDQLKAALDRKCPELVNRKCKIFHQDNSKLHVSLMTRKKLLELGWDILIHLPCSPDIAPSDFHLF